MGPAGIAAAVPAFALQTGAKGLATARQADRARDVTRAITGTAKNNIPLSLLPAAAYNMTAQEIRELMAMSPAEAEQYLIMKEQGIQ